ncbi:alpha/beta fold hydrolase [Calothrix sp. PCC 6303]|uniref:alpha/beta fold hydrolase n=1 Tax=Calothrix sp. PCC 6303 TaxID=1170562 RepID=UPI0002A04D23|nr:alpha/beta fold hydrolase [Calothrix sp. PCC 6303]AFZ03359.1 FAD-dependent pyridine nucleotide-disulfide oxidoreductase [Calothrix sp. PCC 6303]
MTRLSNSIENLKNHYKIVVIGSGYGGGIAASRLARAGQNVCILERGKEFQPGEYPNTELKAIEQLQIDLPNKHIGSKTGLYDFHVNKDINVFVGCGLGGTSLINANVSLRAERRVLEDTRFPQKLRDDINTLLAEGYERAEEMLKPTPYPEFGFPPLPKLAALEKSAEFLNEKFYRPPINVTFQDGVNHVGVEQKKCNLCGDCVTGCNNKAKNTTLMNYLPDAKNHGAEIYTQISVQWVERQGDKWLIHYQLLGSGREKFQAPTMFISADIVILAAGTLGSTEILLRSAAHGLPVSSQLGGNFSGNGDVLAFGYNTDQKINAVGYGNLPAEKMEAVGPCITGIIDIREQPRLENGMVIEEGSIPGAISRLLPKVFASAGEILGKDTDSGIKDFAKEKFREFESKVYGARTGAVNNTQTYLVMTHDNAGGRMYLESDRLRVEWQAVGEQPIFERVNSRLTDATKPLGGTQIPNPVWSQVFKQKDLVTVHPLGGCIMGENATSGVVNHKGQVFADVQGEEVHTGLYVCDGAVIPRSLGVNPLLTISAIAERCCRLIAQDYGWEINYNLPEMPMAIDNPEGETVGIEFTETMRGNFSLENTNIETKFEFTLSIIASDLEKMLADVTHPAKIIGTVTAPAISPTPLTVTNGEFNLFVVDVDGINTKKMHYRFPMWDEDGKIYYLDGFKIIHDHPGFDLWDDTTTLYITVHDGDTTDAAILGKGVLKIQPQDLMRQMSTVRITNTQNRQQRIEYTAKFGKLFLGVLFNTYGEIFARPSVFKPGALPRQKRTLRVSTPEVYFFQTPGESSVQLRLTRYQGGKKGPVMLVHGLGVSSSMFSIDTIDTNLVEYLYANEYDVWLLDYRSSIELAASQTTYTGDDIALKDYPVAVDKIRQITSSETIQVIVHCFGATTFFMAMLAGLKGVRSAVCSQMATHLKVPLMTALKSGFYLASTLEMLGISSLTAYVDSNANWLNQLYDKALKLYPVDAGDGDNSPVSRRISFIYGQLYELDQLNQATYNAMHEMFGIVTMRSLEHIALMIRKGHLVNILGQEDYIPHLERLAIPITFIHGEKNNCLLPKSTEISHRLLAQKNGKHLYTRHVIPNYGHLDCILGKNASYDVYPLILEHLEKT